MISGLIGGPRPPSVTLFVQAFFVTLFVQALFVTLFVQASPNGYGKVCLEIFECTPVVLLSLLPVNLIEK